MRAWTEAEAEALHQTDKAAWNVWMDCLDNATDLGFDGQAQVTEALSMFAVEADSRSIARPRTYHSDRLGRVTIPED